jgi:hypothetical protein
MSVTTHLHDLVNIKAETLTRDRGPFGVVCFLDADGNKFFLYTDPATAHAIADAFAAHKLAQARAMEGSA